MLENWIKPQIPEEEELEERLHAARSKLSVLQMQIKEHGLPVLVLFEGWGTAGKGSVLGKVIKNIDPRFFKVATMDEPTEEERRKPFLYRYFVKIPAKGKFEFLDSGWMDEVVKDVLHDKIGEKEYKKKIESVKRFERQLTDNGYLVMKFFFQISRKEQKKRIEVAERMTWCLEYITVDGDPMRGTQMHAEVVDGNLNFFVNYDCFLYRKKVPGEAMETVGVDPRVKG